jgi:DNA repair photolyase
LIVLGSPVAQLRLTSVAFAVETAVVALDVMASRIAERFLIVAECAEETTRVSVVMVSPIVARLPTSVVFVAEMAAAAVSAPRVIFVTR